MRIPACSSGRQQWRRGDGMVETSAVLWEGTALERRLRELDGPGRDEPVDFDGPRLAAKVNALAALIEESFPGAVSVDGPLRDWQDSATFTHVTVDGAANRTSADLVICISRHGDLCFIALERPGAYSREEFDALADPEDLRPMTAALEALDFTVAREESLWSRYDGPLVMSHPSWLERYFGYPL
ncbi:hypothetical protein [Rathayibacter sp. VKM Ac-2760]|uniref:hypothetical protein n=1 Tax=Rathayibacter sp. VKM Ac-2760 TaxID=2609253 RepID=UPI00131738E3|nr:hypothetical protein [Rathayibacter sp. VKM Ac-2760]QHC58650.1 hypothetical protein GSU72_08870 [Rathayibacter sp. VKM Ac-2760]